MKVKKFIAPTMPEVMKQVRMELGNDAVILNSKVVQKGGFFGFFSRKNIEVIAAIDPEPLSKNIPVKRKLASAEVREETPVSPNTIQKTKEEDPQELIKEIQELKQLVQGLPSKKASVIENYPETIQNVYHRLVKQEVSKENIEELLDQLLVVYYKQEAKSIEELIAFVEDEMLTKLTSLPFGGIDFNKQFLNIVGPTGVGKTTTIAKIAAICVLKFKKRVAFITTDTYRIAAIDQLKTYAQILNVPVEVAYTLDDFKKAKEKFSDYDLVLIDTAGRNFRNKEYIVDLKKLIDFDQEVETFLVLSLASKYSDMDVIVQQFSLLHINRFIFTKVDETASAGSMYNLMIKYKTGAAYITNGQNVPDDIIEATPRIVVNTIFGVQEQ